MGKVRFRKTKSFGPLKVTVTPKGIGTSIGVKGARIGRGVDGKTRVSASLPGTGLSYQHTVGSKPKQSRAAAPPSRTAPAQAPTIQSPRANYWVGFVLNFLIPGLGMLAIGRLGWGLAWIAILIVLGVSVPGMLPLIWLGSLVHYHLLFKANPGAKIQIADAPPSAPPRSAGNVPDPAALPTYLNPGEVPPRPGLPVGFGEVGVFATYQVERNRLVDASSDLYRLTDRLINEKVLSPDFIQGATFLSVGLGASLVGRFGQDDAVLAEKVLALLKDAQVHVDRLLDAENFHTDTQFYFVSRAEGASKTYIFQADGLATAILMYPEERTKLGLPEKA